MDAIVAVRYEATLREIESPEGLEGLQVGGVRSWLTRIVEYSRTKTERESGCVCVGGFGGVPVAPVDRVQGCVDVVGETGSLKPRG